MKNQAEIVLNARELPRRVEAGSELEVQLAPLGEWPQTVEGKDGKPKEIVQRFDEAACNAVVASFKKELLVDLDHESVEGGSTRAYAWVTGLRADKELGLVGTFKFTEAGAEAVNGREYRFVSVCWYLDKDGRPEELDSVALTNRPNLPVRPVLNRERAAAKNAEGDNLEQGTERTENMDKLKEMLGLPPDATDEQVADAVSALKAKADELSEAAEEAEAAEFAKNHQELVADAEALKKAYRADKELAKAMVANFKRPKPQQVLNAAAAKTPELDGRTLAEKLAGMSPEAANAELLKM